MKTRALKYKTIKALLTDIAPGIDVIETIPLVDLKPALKETLERLERGLIPESYRWNREKTARAYSYKNYRTWARSIIIAAKYYLTDEQYPEDKAFGQIARYTWRNNYRFLKIKLDDIVRRLAEKIESPIKSKTLSNYTSIPEKALFRYSGIADVGKNSVLISRNMGSYFVIGEVFTDLEIDFEGKAQLKTPDYSLCGSCTLCIKACPTQAILPGGRIAIGRCLQYISENLTLMPHEYREIWGNRLYGCSTCLDICPHNQRLTPWAEKHVTGCVGQGLRLLDALMLKESEWPGIFSDNQIGIRSYGSFIKNAITSCGSLEYKKSLDYLIPFVSHENEIIRAYTCWALGKLHTKSTKNILERQYNQEENHLVKSEIERFL